MISFNWQFNASNGFYILSFQFHPDEKPYDNVWRVRKDHDGCVKWAPSHLEQAQISELLGLANRINGLSKLKRDRLRPLIDRDLKEDFDFKLSEHSIETILEAFHKVDAFV